MARARRRTHSVLTALLLAGLAACTQRQSPTAHDLAAIAAAAVLGHETARIDLGAPDEPAAVLDGFAEPARLPDGTHFRSVGPDGASVRVWLLREVTWRLRLRYRFSGSSPAVASLGPHELFRLGPASEWTELGRTLTSAEIAPGEHHLRLDPHGGLLEVDWIDLRPLGLPPAAGPAPATALAEHGEQQFGTELTFFGNIASDARRPELLYDLGALDASARVRIRLDGEAWPEPLERVHLLDPRERLGKQRLPLPAPGPLRVRLSAVSPSGSPEGAVRWNALRLLTLAAPPAEPAAARPPAPTAPPPRDIFVFVLDAARADHFGAYGHPRQTSPWVDALAREGHVFHLARTQAPYTQASTATLMTGFEPETHDVRGVNSRLADRAVTLAEILSDAGYATAAYIGCANADRPFGFAQGFDLFQGGRHDSTLESVEQRLRTHERNFFYVHLFPPHHPYFPPPPFAGLYSDATPGSMNGSNDELVAIRRSRTGIPGNELARLRAQYDENLLYGDHLLGEILGLAHQAGRLDDALVLVISDHGEAFLEHGTVLHGFTLYDEELRIPMILRLPRSHGPGGRIVDEPVGTLDVLPTLVELARAQDPLRQRHGSSLVPLLSGARRPDPAIYARAQGQHLAASLATRRYKAIVVQHRVELYDLLADPGERRDLAAVRPFLAGWLGQLVRERHLRNSIDAHAAAMRQDAVLDAETERELRALGYIE
jgi:arylsulfatase A-like enzyme